MMNLNFVNLFIQGPGKLIIIMKLLQKECDRQSRKIIEHFKRQREYDKMVSY